MVQLNSASRAFLRLSPDSIVPSDQNPRGREEFEEAALRELADSIREHGILQPIIVTAPRNGGYRLVEGERRWRAARFLGLDEIPAYAIEELAGRDEIVAMYQIHMQREAWNAADELRAISQLRKAAPEANVGQLARELGMSPQTLRNRLRVLDAGPDIVEAIRRGDLRFTDALRAAEATRTLSNARGKLVRELGGEDRVMAQLAEKGRRRKGLANELVAVRSALGDRSRTADDAVRRYVTDPDATKIDLVDRPVSLPVAPRPSRQRRAASDDVAARMASRIRGWRTELKRFHRELDRDERERPIDRTALKAELALLIETAEGIERDLVADDQLAASMA